MCFEGRKGPHPREGSERRKAYHQPPREVSSTVHADPPRSPRPEASLSPQLARPRWVQAHAGPSGPPSSRAPARRRAALCRFLPPLSGARSRLCRARRRPLPRRRPGGSTAAPVPGRGMSRRGRCWSGPRWRYAGRGSAGAPPSVPHVRAPRCCSGAPGRGTPAPTPGSSCGLLLTPARELAGLAFLDGQGLLLCASVVGEHLLVGHRSGRRDLKLLQVLEFVLDGVLEQYLRVALLDPREEPPEETANSPSKSSHLCRPPPAVVTPAKYVVDYIIGTKNSLQEFQHPGFAGLSARYALRAICQHFSTLRALGPRLSARRLPPVGGSQPLVSPPVSSPRASNHAAAGSGPSCAAGRGPE